MAFDLEKVYEPQRFEPHWAEWWIDNNLYRVEASQAVAGRTFSVVIPPPNVTGQLHIGHMLDHTIQDVAVRWHRMSGEIALWIPGTDHAGISTQMVVERQLAQQNLRRVELGREEFEKRVWQWKEEYGGKIVRQIRREGASVDWARERFTMDAGLSRAVRETFVRLWERGLIYRGEYMVNWCPRCATAISDVETLHEPIEGHLWHIAYRVPSTGEVLTVATTRPETMLGDTALMVHPEDGRYTHLHGKTAILPIVGREIPIVPDTMVDPKFGTGVVKVTPAHDPNDFAAAKRHNLPFVKVIGEDARMTDDAGAAYSGLDRFEARTRVIAALEALGELVKTEPYTVNISKCERCRSVIEPLVSTQWFVRMRTLADKAMDAVRNGRIRFVPDDREPVFFQWMENIRDWCISRQLWWGHRIPAWHCRVCKQMTIARETPATCQHCGSTEIEQDKDVLDTWFSSGLWPFSTLGWPDDTADLRSFYPTSLLITGFDILFFWVARMIMLGLEMTGEVPFREVHMHGLVRDADKQKMSKTKGNVIDPLVVIDQHGTDALRVALLISAAAGADIALKMDRIEAGRAFANKLWNASRLLFMNMDKSGVSGWVPSGAPQLHATEDFWIVHRLNEAIATINRALKLHRYHEAAQTVWDFVWREFCDWYLEVKKLRFREGSGIDSHWEAALFVYEAMLRMAHPVMPFITEELWQRLGLASEGVKSISLAAYPEQIAIPNGAEPVRRFGLIQQIVTAARELRADNKLDPKALMDATLYLHASEFGEEDLAAISSLARLRVKQERGRATGSQAVLRSTPEFELQIHAGEAAGNAVEVRARLEKENANLRKAIDAQERQLSDETFLSKAPAKVIEGMRAKLAGYRAQFEKNQKSLESLG